MRLTKRLAGRGAAAAVLALAFGACSDELPTAGGEGRFPGGARPLMVEVLLSGPQVFTSTAVFDGYSDPRNAPYLVIAQDFEGGLNAHALARFGPFPEAVTYSFGGSSFTDSTFIFVSGELRAQVDSLFSAGQSALLSVSELTEEWDSATVSWDEAAAGRPWATPGGTAGDLLSQAFWARGDTIARDTVTFELGPTDVERLAVDDHPGVLLTGGEANVRVQVNRLELRLVVRPESAPDTTITVTVPRVAQTFIFDPAPPVAEGVSRVGGVTSARTAVQIDLDLEVPGCPDTELMMCEPVPLSEVTIHRAELVVDPIAVPSGFRPLGRSTLLARRLVEPELGRLAPLGQMLIGDTISASAFVGGAPTPVRLDISNAVRNSLALEDGELAIALLADGTAFGYQWYAGAPVLRILYTLPRVPTLP